MKFYKSSLHHNNNKTHTRIFLGVWELTFVVLGGFFWVIDPLYFNLGGRNFFNYIPFLIIYSALNAPIGGFKFSLDTKNNGTLPLNLACHERLKSRSCIIVARCIFMQYNVHTIYTIVVNHVWLCWQVAL